MYEDRNIALLGAFRGDFRINFFNPALMRDPEGILEKRGPNTQTAGMISFKDNAKAGEMEPIIRTYLSEAIGYAKAGILPPKQTRTIPLPDELVDILDIDPEVAEAFHALTPGRQKNYAINIGSAKKPETRYARIAKFRDKILAGKGAMER